MRANSRPDDVVRVFKVNDPVPKGFVNSISQSLATGFDCDDLSTEQSHPEDV